MTPGRPFAVVGPSGVGKDTLIGALAERRPDLHVARRVITRPEEAGGEPFEGVSEADFAARLARGDFVLDWQAHGLSYGIPKAFAEALEAGRDALFNGSRAMLLDARARFPGLVVIHVTARPEVLAERLAERGRETWQDIEKRLERARLALPGGLPVLGIDNSGPLEAAVTALLAAVQPVPRG